jgi:hypothetical protein
LGEDATAVTNGIKREGVANRHGGNRQGRNKRSFHFHGGMGGGEHHIRKHDRSVNKELRIQRKKIKLIENELVTYSENQVLLNRSASYQPMPEDRRRATDSG